MRTAIYCRVNHDQQRPSLSNDRQRQACQELADRHGWTVTGIYEDSDISDSSDPSRARNAGERGRTQYRELLAAVRRGEYDAVITWHTDRLVRHHAELEEWIDAYDGHGVPVHTVQAGSIDLSTPDGRLVARMLGSVARFDSESQSERAGSAVRQ